MIAAAQQGKGLKRMERNHSARRQASCVCVAAAAMAGLAPLVKKGARSSSESGEKVAEKVRGSCRPASLHIAAMAELWTRLGAAWVSTTGRGAAHVCL
jgi:hypothetical protein